jgi:hypothetical protein
MAQLAGSAVQRGVMPLDHRRAHTVVHTVPEPPSFPAAPAPVADAAVGIRRTFYRQHLVAAQYFAEGAYAAELRGIIGAGRQLVRTYRDLVAASVLSAAAYLEISVNELYLELRDGGSNGGRHSSRRLVARLAREWRVNQSAPTLQKYQLILSLWDGDTFHPRRTPYTEAERLIRWRDVLVTRARGPLLHAEQVERAGDLAREPDRRPPVPEGLHIGRLRLDAACAWWAVRSAVAFSEEFCRRMHLPSREFGEPTRPSHRRPAAG